MGRRKIERTEAEARRLRTEYQKKWTAKRVPHKAEWTLNIRYGGEKFADLGYYFAGYFTLAEINGGYNFTVCEPFAD